MFWRELENPRSTYTAKPLFWDETRPWLCDLNLPFLIPRLVFALTRVWKPVLVKTLTAVCIFIYRHWCCILISTIFHVYVSVWLYFFLYFKIVKCIISFWLFLALHLHYLHKRYYEVHWNSHFNRKKDVLGLTLQLNLEERVICYGRSSYSQE